MRRFSIWDIIISVIALTVVCVTVVPAVARLQRTPEDARCQSNMRRIAGAIQQYTNDWDGCYPTNRMKPSLALTSQAFLSPYDPVNQHRYVNSINWVEALYDHIEPVARQSNPVSVWKCPMAGNSRYPLSSTTAAVTYVFNYNLLEQPTAFSRNRAKLMLMREMDRMVEAICRPSNSSTNNLNTIPSSPFLTSTDNIIRNVAINSNLHTQGSHVLFADGHVSYFGAECYPSQLSQASQWNPETQQWWNWVNTNSALDKTIAITP